MTQRKSDDALVINGWSIHAHPKFLDAVEALVKEVERLRTKDPKRYRQKRPTKLLAAIFQLAFETIPQDPSRAEYRQGATLGDHYKHWFRAKFFQQYRLFFRYHREARIIIYAWVNDEDTKRAYERSDDAYRTFRNMLDAGNPPDNWETLRWTTDVQYRECTAFGMRLHRCMWPGSLIDSVLNSFVLLCLNDHASHNDIFFVLDIADTRFI